MSRVSYFKIYWKNLGSQKQEDLPKGKALDNQDISKILRDKIGEKIQYPYGCMTYMTPVCHVYYC